MKRYFIVFYTYVLHDSERRFDEFSIVLNEYPNRDKCIREISLLGGGRTHQAITNIIELSKADYMEYIRHED